MNAGSNKNEKEASEERRKSEAIYKQLVQALPAPLYTCDAEGRILLYNHPAAVLWGRHPRIGKDLWCGSRRIYRPDGSPLPHDECPMAVAIKEGRGVSDEVLIERPDGARANVLVDAQLLRDESGAVKGAVNLMTDISEQKRLHRRKDEFLAMLAHELRNPLAAVSSAVELLGTACGAEHIETGRKIIGRQTRLLARLVDDLLDMSRITRGSVLLRNDVLNAQTVVRHAVETVKPLIERRRHEISVSIEKKPLWLEGDAARLEQLIGNLLTNSAKYTEPGGRIEVEARRRLDTISITVRDNGNGIPADLLPDVFELFSQSSRADDRSDAGLGIGLTLARSIAELHGGSIEARSEGYGKGSEFTVCLPALAEDSTSQPAAREAAPATISPPARRVLLVDDNEDAAIALSRLLETAGHKVQTTHDGPSALEAAAAGQPDAILLDIGLPGLNGYEVAKRLRQNAALPDLLLIAISGYCQEDDRERSAEAGFDHHLAKPIDHRQLLGLLGETAPAGSRQD